MVVAIVVRNINTITITSIITIIINIISIIKGRRALRPLMEQRPPVTAPSPCPKGRGPLDDTPHTARPPWPCSGARAPRTC